ncbi:MAG: hypothetical protein AAF432_11230 [Planctomycetota bacterium]
MQIETFVLCHAATDSGRGQLNVLGTFDMLFARQLPAVQAQCAIALRMRFERSERREHQLAISIVDADGTKLGPAPDIKVPVNFPDQLTSHAFNFIFNLQQLRFEHFGEYAIGVALNGDHQMSLPFSVREMPQQQQQQGGPPQDWPKIDPSQRG